MSVTKEWEQEGFTQADIQNWVRSRVESPSIAKRWLSFGLGPLDAYDFHSVGITKAEDAVPWLEFTAKNSLSFDHIFFAHDAGCREPEEAQEWLDNGLDLYNAIDWHHLGKTPSEAASLACQIGAGGATRALLCKALAVRLGNAEADRYLRLHPAPSAMLRLMSSDREGSVEGGLEALTSGLSDSHLERVLQLTDSDSEQVGTLSLEDVDSYIEVVR